MSKSVTRVIGIIRINETLEFDGDLPGALDDSTLGSLLAGLVGKQVAGPQHRRRFECAAPAFAHSGFRSVVRADLPRLRDELERQYRKLAAR